MNILNNVDGKDTNDLYNIIKYLYQVPKQIMYKYKIKTNNLFVIILESIYN